MEPQRKMEGGSCPQHVICKWVSKHSRRQPDLQVETTCRGEPQVLERYLEGRRHHGRCKIFLFLDFSWVFHDFYNSRVEIRIWWGGGRERGFVCFEVERRSKGPQRAGNAQLALQLRGCLQAPPLLPSARRKQRPSLPAPAEWTACPPGALRQAGLGPYQRHKDHPRGSGSIRASTHTLGEQAQGAGEAEKTPSFLELSRDAEEKQMDPGGTGWGRDGAS